MTIIEMDFVIKKYREKRGGLFTKINGMPGLIVPYPYKDEAAKQEDENELKRLDLLIPVMDKKFEQTLKELSNEMVYPFIC